MDYQFTQGTMVVVSLNTTDQLGHPITPDGGQTPTISIAYITPSGPVVIDNGALMTAITNSFYYFSKSSTFLSVGSYTATSSWVYQGQILTYTSRFDILAFDGQTLLPLDPISRLRIRLKDNDPDPRRWIWKDQELSEYLNDALENFNAMPPRMNFFWFNIPVFYVDTILLYAEYLAIKAQAFKLASQGVAYNDRNISLNIPAQAALYQSMARELQQIASDKAKLLKRQYSYGTGYIATPSLAMMSVPPLRAWGRGWSF